MNVYKDLIPYPFADRSYRIGAIVFLFYNSYRLAEIAAETSDRNCAMILPEDLSPSYFVPSKVINIVDGEYHKMFAAIVPAITSGNFEKELSK